MFRNLPNLITFARLVLVPFILRELWRKHFDTALLLLCIAGATDALDGYLARTFNWASRLGAYLDPLGDKLLLVSVYITLGLNGAIPMWLMWLVLGRDLSILGMVAIAFLFTSVRSFPPSPWGKLSTIVQVFTAITLIAARAYFGTLVSPILAVLIPATALVTAWSLVHYAWVALQRFPSVRH